MARNTMLKTIKTAALKSSRSVGLFGVVGRSRWRNHRLLILCYHGVSQQDEHVWNPALYIPQDSLRRQLQLLARNNCSVLPLGEAFTRLRRNDLPPRSVVITFDDGPYDFLTRALPVIRPFRVPVTVYQTSYYSGFNRPVFDVTCSYLLWKGQGKRIDGRDFTGTAGLLELSRETSRAAACLQIRQYAAQLGLSAHGKDELLEGLAHALGVDFQRVRGQRLLHLMKPDEVQQVIREGVDVQLHTHRHRMPPDRDLFAREINENRRFLAAVGQTHPQHFCYPSGEYGECFLPWLAELGVQSATTCERGLATSHTPPLLLPRIGVPSSLTDIEFEGWLTGIGQVFPSASFLSLSHHAIRSWTVFS